MRSTLASILATPILAAGLAAQGELGLDVCTRGLGKAIDYGVSGGRAFFPFLFFTSAQRGSFALSAIDPKDSRRLGVGFDLLPILLLGRFDAKGQAKFSLNLPNDASLAGKSLLHQALAFPGTSLLFGGLSQVQVVPLEASRTWRDYKPRAMVFDRAFAAAMPERDGRILVAGGGRGGLLALSAWDSSEWYDVNTRSFSTGPKLTQTRGIYGSSELADGRVLLTGGVNSNNDPQNSCEWWDPKASKFVAAPSMQGKRMVHTHTQLDDGRVLVTGGLSDLNGQLQALTSAVNTTEIYDPKTNKWSAGPRLSEPKAGHTAIKLADGRILLIGGVTWRLVLVIKVPSFSGIVDVYDPKTNKISRVASLSNGRAAASAFRLANGRVVVAGGAGGSITGLGTPTASCEIYDPTANRWTATGSLLKAKALAGQVLELPDGRFGLFGGARGNLLNPLAVNECELYDPATGKWSALPPLLTARVAHVLLRTRSCAILAIGGGTGQSGSTLKTQELFVY